MKPLFSIKSLVVVICSKTKLIAFSYKINEFAKMILKRNEVKTVMVEVSLFSKVKSFFKAA